VLCNFPCIAKRLFDCISYRNNIMSEEIKRERKREREREKLINYHCEKVCWHFASSAFVTPRIQPTAYKCTVDCGFRRSSMEDADKQCKFDVALQRCQEVDNNLCVNILAIHDDVSLRECVRRKHVSKTLTAQTLRWSLTPPPR